MGAMIEVRALTKLYGTVEAVRDLSDADFEDLAYFLARVR